MLADRFPRVDLPDLLLPATDPDVAPRPAYPRDVWLPGIQVMAARERDNDDSGLFLAAKGGHNDESHNHNDVGNFIVYLDGEPLIVDAGVGTYTRQTFSPRRYDLWTMQSAWHNLPTVNGAMQCAGHTSCAADSLAEFRLDIAGAYPPEAGIVRWRRTLQLRRTPRPSVLIGDDFSLCAPGDVTLSLLVVSEPTVASDGVLLLRSGDRVSELLYPGDALAVSVLPVPLDDERLLASWQGGLLHRITFTARCPVADAGWEMTISPLPCGTRFPA